MKDVRVEKREGEYIVIDNDGNIIYANKSLTAVGVWVCLNKCKPIPESEYSFISL